MIFITFHVRLEEIFIFDCRILRFDRIIKNINHSEMMACQSDLILTGSYSIRYFLKSFIIRMYFHIFVTNHVAVYVFYASINIYHSNW